MVPKIRTYNSSEIMTGECIIDHIIPQSMLQYSSMEEDNFKKCWALENLRPYSSKQNNKDGNRRLVSKC